MRFRRFREYNDHLKATTGVHEREALVRQLLSECEDTSERVIAAMLLVGRLSQPQEGLTTGIKEAFLANDLGLDGRQSLEDLAKVAMERAEVGLNDYTVGEVWAIFRSYLESTGRKAVDKTSIINIVMFRMAAEKEDVPLLLRILCEKVNNGIDDKTILYAIDNGQNPREEISRAFAFNPNLAHWVTKLCEPDEPFLTAFAQAGVALEPQLCARMDRLEDVLKEHNGNTIVQPKLDGQRVHIHVMREGELCLVHIFSRALKDVTKNYPEIVESCKKLHVKHMTILDGELIALDADGSIAPFSLLQKRLGRKEDHDVVQVGVVLYDVLLWDEEKVAAMPYMRRMQLLQEKVRLPRFQIIHSEVVVDTAALKQRLLEAAEAGEEGLVCKDPNSKPSPGMRSKDWVKLKADYLGGDFADTYDLVVIGYQKGRGKRHGKIGALWVAIRDGDRPENLWPVCKVGTGLTEEDLDWFQANLRPIDKVPVHVWGFTQASKAPDVDVLVEPDVVIEVGATGGMTKIDCWAGFSLRFPYFIKVREDKDPKQATSTSEVILP